MEHVQTIPVVGETTKVENEPETKLTHWVHPTDSTIQWCGVPRKKPGFRNVKAGSLSISCPICIDLHRRFGSKWWWDTHRRNYESQCHAQYGWTFHDCIAAA